MWLGHMVGIRLTFKRTTKLFCKVVILFHLSTSNVRRFQLLHILTNTWSDQSILILNFVTGVF